MNSNTTISRARKAATIVLFLLCSFTASVRAGQPIADAKEEKTITAPARENPWKFQLGVPGWLPAIAGTVTSAIRPQRSRRTATAAPAAPGGMLVPFIAVVMRAVARGVRMQVAHASGECQRNRIAAHR